MFWTLPMTLGFPRKKLPVSEESKLSLKVNEDCLPGPEDYVLCFCFFILRKLLKLA